MAEKEVKIEQQEEHKYVYHPSELGEQHRSYKLMQMLRQCNYASILQGPASLGFDRSHFMKFSEIKDDRYKQAEIQQKIEESVKSCLQLLFVNNLAVIGKIDDAIYVTRPEELGQGDKISIEKFCVNFWPAELRLLNRYEAAAKQLGQCAILEVPNVQNTSYYEFLFDISSCLQSSKVTRTELIDVETVDELVAKLLEANASACNFCMDGDFLDSEDLWNLLSDRLKEEKSSGSPTYKTLILVLLQRSTDEMKAVPDVSLFASEELSTSLTTGESVAFSDQSGTRHSILSSEARLVLGVLPPRFYRPQRKSVPLYKGQENVSGEEQMKKLDAFLADPKLPYWEASKLRTYLYALQSLEQIDDKEAFEPHNSRLVIPKDSCITFEKFRGLLQLI